MWILAISRRDTGCKDLLGSDLVCVCLLLLLLYEDFFPNARLSDWLWSTSVMLEIEIPIIVIWYVLG